MPVARLAAFAVSVTQQTKAKLQWMTHVTGTRNDVLKWAMTVTALLESVAASSFRLYGARLYMDKGDGSLSQVKGSEIAPEITLNGSLDGFGVREVSFTRYGEDQSPLKNALLRGMRRVTLSGVAAIPGSFMERAVFDGYIRDADFDGFPPTARITAQDSSLPYSNKRMVYSLAAGSGTAREEVFRDICSDHGIPVGTVEDLNGYIYKPISEGGEKTVLDFFSEWLVPTGARAYWRDGKLNVRRFDTSRTPVRTLRADDIRSIRIVPPSTNTPNLARYSAAIFNYTGPSGRRTVPVDESSTATYSPKVATLRQNTDGSETPLTLSSPTGTHVVSRRIGSRVYDGGSLVEEHITEYGWYAPRACNLQQAVTTGTISDNSSFPVYQFADGSWRATIQEEFQVVRRYSMVRSFETGSGFLSSEQEWVTQYHGVEVPRGTMNNTTAAEQYNAVFLTADGVAWETGKEQLITEHNQINYYVNNNDEITLRNKIIDSYTRTAYLPSFKPTGAYTGTIYWFGPTDAKKYGSNPQAPARLVLVQNTYSPVGESSHRESAGSDPENRFFPGTFQQIPPASSVVVPGPMPTVEQLTDFQQAQPATITLKDQLRIALAQGIELPENRQNDYCENPAEIETACLELLREISAPQVIIEKGWDFMCEEGEVVAVNHPKLGHETVNLLVWSQSATLNGASGANSQTLVCRWYTPEIEDNE